MSGNFSPWNENFNRSWAASFAGLLVGWPAMLSAHPYLATAIMLATSWVAIDQWRQGRERERGIEVEHAAIAELQRELAPLGYRIQHDVAAGWLGNIDAIIQPPDFSGSFVVEIKAYTGIIRRPWGITKPGKHYPLRAASQVKRQCKHQGPQWHFPVLWCPTSKLNNIGHYGNIVLVNGGVNLLARAISDRQPYLRLPAFVRFPCVPPPACRRALLQKRFQFIARHLTWYGTAAQCEVRELAAVATAGGGQFGFRVRERTAMQKSH